MSERLPNWLKKRASISPNRPAIEFEGKVYTFKALHELVEHKVKKLAAAGIKKGSFCAVLMKNHIDTVLCIHALFYLGVKIVMLNNKLTKNELEWQIQHCEASFLITEDNLIEKVENQQHCQVWRKEDIEKLQVVFQPQIADEFPMNDIATVMYTSGTTGKPKGVIQTFGNHWWSAIGSALNLGLEEKDSWYCAVPIFHISGLSILMRNVIYGMKVVLAEKFSESAVNYSIRYQGVTIISVVTAMLNRIIADLGEEQYPHQFRCMLLGGGPAPYPLLKTCKEKSIPVFQSYGLTETASQIVTLSPEDNIKKIGSAGKALMPSQIKIEKGDQEAKPHETGEILVKGPNVTPGYLHQPETTKRAIKDGWLHTGDVGYMDHEGFLFVLDRRSDLIISGGENVYPAEIEAVLTEYPVIFEAGVTGQKDDKWGEVPVAFVVLKDNDYLLDKEELLSFCEKRLAPYKLPREIIVCDKLPRNGAGKLVRKDLKIKSGDGE